MTNLTLRVKKRLVFGKQNKALRLIYNVSNHFLDGLPIHIDFYEVEMDKLITAHVPVVFVGESPAVKLGGVLVKPTQEIEVEALPMDLPHEIVVDISTLTDFDQTLCVKDINFSPKVKVLIDENTPVATVNAPITEEELEKELGEAKTVEEVEVEGEKKEEGEEESTEESESKEKKEQVSEEDNSKKQ